MKECVCVARVHGRSRILSNTFSGYGGIRVVRVSDDLCGSSSRGRGGVVAK